MANYSWILMEGLYLHNLIFFAPFSDNSAITLYVALGWGFPAITVLPWIIVRATLENTLCWTTNLNQYYFLIIRIPTILSILINFILFLNIVRVLLLKLRSSVSVETRKYRYRKWAKSTLVLVPLFGVHYMVFLGMSYSIGVDETVELTWLFCDQLFASFQGFFVAILYCLLNGEVRVELSKRWSRASHFILQIWTPSCISRKTRLSYRRRREDKSGADGGTVPPGTCSTNPNGNGEKRVQFGNARSTDSDDLRFGYQTLSSPRSSQGNCPSVTDTTQWSVCTKSTDVSPQLESHVWTIANNCESTDTAVEMEGLKSKKQTSE